ncbi:MAG: prepilin-type N-terminal cleavage/methylation domain-containing protein [Acaryochloris sp. RU_4_1]|nr:prepilin-type N-terminal cleavage/methylation domain-containing protein [Acaryochloris sp. RU_4_1]NJR54725.1 prepilin-type N-terminal cleavage/methylation domain-containing protein [Acaryochloris sp. CRU_2_0]
MTQPPSSKAGFPRSFLRSATAGFTLPELLIASVILGIVIAMAGAGLINIWDADKRNTTEAERQSELNRALDFIVDDIKSAQSVSTSGVPIRSGYVGVFKLTTANGESVAYYTAAKSTNLRWRGPRVVYRREFGSPERVYALVDAIANVPPTCPSNGGDQAGDHGLRVFIQDEIYVKICLIGQLNNSRTVMLETQAFRRGVTPPP